MKTKSVISLVVITAIAFSCKKNNQDENKPIYFFPSQNLEKAYEAGAQGCACDEKIDKSTCLTDKNGKLVALICEKGKWQTVEDVSCTPQLK